MSVSSPQIRVTDPAAFGKAAADAISEALHAFSAPVAGLASGATPIPAYRALAERCGCGKPALGGIRGAFAIDEYVCPRDHPAANRAFFARHWDCIASAPPAQGFDPEAPDLAEEARRLSAAIAAAGGLDVVVLGIGINGHLAFNEPGSTADSPARLVRLEAATRLSAEAAFGLDPPAEGLTLGLGELLAARRVVLLASGERKAAIVARALSGAVDTACPASFLQLHRAVTVVLDSAAACGLSAAMRE